MTIREKLFSYLEQRPEGAPAAELTALALCGQPGDSELNARILHQLIGNDQAFIYDPQVQRWSLAQAAGLQLSPDQAEYVVVDLETTGGRPGQARIIEIGAYRMVGAKMLERFESLVRPRVGIPRFISEMTSITDAMVAQAPALDEVLARFRDFLGDAVLVAHNAQFDFGFLDFEFRRLFGVGVRNPVLCTLRLARRLLPSLRRRGLDALAEHFGLSLEGRHRALGDARMASEVLGIFLEMTAQMGIRRLDLLLDYQHAGSAGRRIERHIAPEQLGALPSTPGVYLMRNERGELLYVGKARNLKRRVSSYFSSLTHKRKVIELVCHVYAIETQGTRSSLEAALLEARLIREHKPPYNRLLKSAPPARFVRLDLRERFPRLALATRLRLEPQVLQFGPFVGAGSLERALAVLARLVGLRVCHGALEPAPDFSPCIYGQIGHCAAPCNLSLDEAGYQQRVSKVVEFLRGQSGPLMSYLARSRDMAAQALRYEEAARLTRDLQALAILAAHERRLSRIVTDNNLVIVDGGLATVILSGRLVRQMEFTAPAAISEICALVREQYERYRLRPIERAELEPMLLVARWLRERAPEEGHLVFLSGPMLPAQLLEPLLGGAGRNETDSTVAQADA